MPPVQMGGHAATSHLVPALLPPHRKNHEQQAPGNGDVMFWLRHAASKPMRDRIANEICAEGWERLAERLTYHQIGARGVPG